MTMHHITHLSVVRCCWFKCRLQVPFGRSIEKDGLRFCSQKCAESFFKDEAEFQKKHGHKHFIPVLHHAMQMPSVVELDYNHFGARRHD